MQTALSFYDSIQTVKDANVELSYNCNGICLGSFLVKLILVFLELTSTGFENIQNEK